MRADITELSVPISNGICTFGPRLFTLDDVFHIGP